MWHVIWNKARTDSADLSRSTAGGETKGKWRSSVTALTAFNFPQLKWKKEEKIEQVQVRRTVATKRGLLASKCSTKNPLPSTDEFVFTVFLTDIKLRSEIIKSLITIWSISWFLLSTNRTPSPSLWSNKNNLTICLNSWITGIFFIILWMKCIKSQLGRHREYTYNNLTRTSQKDRGQSSVYIRNRIYICVTKMEKSPEEH